MSSYTVCAPKELYLPFLLPHGQLSLNVLIKQVNDLQQRTFCREICREILQTLESKKMRKSKIKDQISYRTL